MKKTAFVFPGQGSQSVGMAKGFFDLFDASRKTFEEASSALGFDIADISFNGPADVLDRTENTQPALLTASVAMLRALREKASIEPAFYAGHSLGEYTALVATGAIGFGAAVRLVNRRGVFMQESVPQGVGKMCAILGLDIETVRLVCASASIDAAQVVPANINSPEQIVISGHAAAVDIAASYAREKGAKRVIPLQVSAPSHSPLMEAAAQRLSTELSGVEVSRFTVPVITNVEAEPTTDQATIKGLLVAQLTSPVRWVEVVGRMKKEGVTDIVEIGPGKVLAGLVKRIDKDINTHNISEPADLERVLGALAQ